jgi:hypothetical protein
MHFMFVILAFLLCMVVGGFFHANPRGVAVGGLLRNLLLFPLSRRSAA